MTQSLCIFEDPGYTRLLPLVYMRPVYELRCGMTTLRQKLVRWYPGVPATLRLRGYLSDLVRLQNPGIPVNTAPPSSCLFLNGRVIADESLIAQIPLHGEDAVYVEGETLVAARVSGSAMDRRRTGLPEVLRAADFDGLTRRDVKVKKITYPWDLVNANGEEITADFRLFTTGVSKRTAGHPFEGVYLINPDAIFIEEGARVKPGVVLDAEQGPIYIGKDVLIFPHVTIEGPACIGEGSRIKAGAKIYECTSIGPVCKVGGEVECSIVHGYANKQHDGFLGHSYLGMWVNLGADTNNSDLKNNYGHVRVTIDGEQVDSGSVFAGLFMGDHSKSAINTMFNTGTVVGVSSNVFGAGFPPKSIPSFAWGGADEMSVYDLDRSLDVARRVMGRRNTVMSEVEENLFRNVFDLTREERRRAGMQRE
jgi:UDP-N-acetylglucosamine diphosphorylase / glucose-1-phosphate thymidylyltransferase / UDP-N-acetylgalactosamine diphosphorylase / glucosamine-1-phosphate N-acetyltransferase / galactosamine-1-phosphate N-acetyltransferase